MEPDGCRDESMYRSPGAAGPVRGMQARGGGRDLRDCDGYGDRSPGPRCLGRGHGIAVDGDGTVYVTDKMEQPGEEVHSSERDPLGSWRRHGGGLKLRRRGSHVSGATARHRLCRLDYFRVQKFTKTGVFVSAWGGDGRGQRPVLLPRGSPSTTTATSTWPTPTTTGSRSSRRPAGFVAKWGTVGSGNGDFMFPYDIGTGGDGYVYVWQTASIGGVSRNLRRPDSSSAAWGGTARVTASIDAPGGIAFDGAGYLYVTDWEADHRVQKFTTTGSYAATLDTSSPYDDASGETSGPTGIAIDSERHHPGPGRQRPHQGVPGCRSPTSLRTR